MSFQNLQKMPLGRSRDAGVVYFCSGPLIRHNDLQNRNGHFDRKNVTWNAEFYFFCKRKLPIVIYFDQ